MKGAEYQCFREFLHLPVAWVSRVTGVPASRIREIELADAQVPAFLHDKMTTWIDEASQMVGKLTVHYQLKDVHVIPAASDVTPAGHLRAWLCGYPPSFQRGISARVAERTKLPICWRNDFEDDK